MSILASLVRAYDRLPDAPPFGYSNEKVGFMVSLDEDGSVAHVIDLRTGEGRRRQPKSILVPTSFKRSGTSPRPFFLWDNANYALGIGAIEDQSDRRFPAFREKHLTFLEDESDIGLVAFRRFLEAWSPSTLKGYVSLPDIETQKIVFALEAERQTRFLHERDRAVSLWGEIIERWQAVEGKTVEEAVCLVTGRVAKIARTHPAIKGIPSKGGKDADSIVSFNLDAFTSYGHDQGENAPVSEEAAFKYTAVLNRYLERDSGHRLQIGDASTVFWADAADRATAERAESYFTFMVDPPGAATADDDAAREVGVKLEQIRQGQQLGTIEPELAAGVRFHVLGLAPNAARLSVRFYFEDDFGRLTENYQRFVSDMRIEPPRGYPPLWRYLQETAVLGKRENVTPNLAGDWMRSILAGTRYPQTLTASVLTRIRADGAINALRAGILKAQLIRNFNMEAPVALDPENRNRGYLLGRLFAVYEQIQTAALGAKVNATVKDKFYGSASATPRKVFHLLDRGSANHLSKIGKQNSDYRRALETRVAKIMEAMDPNADPFPASLAAEEQALFGLGYYHQRFFKKPAETAATGETDA